MLTELTTKFEGHFQVIQGELHAELEGTRDTVALQYSLMRAKQRLIDRCYTGAVNAGHGTSDRQTSAAQLRLIRYRHSRPVWRNKSRYRHCHSVTEGAPVGVARRI